METLFGRGGRRLLKLDKKREMLCRIVIKIHYFEEFLYFNGLDLRGGGTCAFFSCLSRGALQRALRGGGSIVPGSGLGSEESAHERGAGEGGTASATSRRAWRAMPGDSLRELLLVRDRRCHRRAERRRTARPRGSRPDNGAPPGNPRPFPPSPRPAPLRAAAAAAPGSALQNGGRSLFAATAASIRPAGRRDRPTACPPALRGEDSSPVLRGRARQGSPR